MSWFFLLILQVMLATTFLVAAFSKYKDINAFQEAVAQFGVIPAQYAKTVAIVIILLELTSSVLLCANELLTGFFVAILILLIFTIVLIISLVKREKISCNCFGPDERFISGYDLLRNFFLMACVIIGMLLLPQRGSQSFTFTLWDITLGVIMSLIMTLFILNIETFIQPMVGSKRDE